MGPIAQDVPSDVCHSLFAPNGDGGLCGQPVHDSAEIEESLDKSTAIGSFRATPMVK